MRALDSYEIKIKQCLAEKDAMRLSVMLDIPENKTKEACQDYFNAHETYLELFKTAKISNVYDLSVDFQKTVCLLVRGLIYEKNRHD